MSKFVIHISPPDYLADWIVHTYYNSESMRVEFPRSSPQRAILHSFLTATPKRSLFQPGTVQPPSSDGRNIPVEVPTFPGLNPASHNYLSPKGKAALISICRSMFKAQLWEDVRRLTKFGRITSAVIDAILEKYEIEHTDKNWQAVRQICVRMVKIIPDKDD